MHADADANPNGQFDDFHGIQDLGDEVTLCSDFDRHGVRLVTGSGDHKIRVLDRNAENEFKITETFRAHDGYVNCVGSLFAGPDLTIADSRIGQMAPSQITTGPDCKHWPGPEAQNMERERG